MPLRSCICYSESARDSVHGTNNEDFWTRTKQERFLFLSPPLNTPELPLQSLSWEEPSLAQKSQLLHLGRGPWANHLFSLDLLIFTMGINSFPRGIEEG